MISIVIPVYNEEESIEALAAKLPSSIRGEWEAIFVDDGSTDRTPDILKTLKGKDSHFKVLRLSRNFGQSAALAAGIDFSHGEFVVTLDGDGQNDPADIASMLDTLEKGNFDVVCGWRENRNDGFLRVAASKLANCVLRSITGLSLHDYGCTLRVYRPMRCRLPFHAPRSAQRQGRGQFLHPGDWFVFPAIPLASRRWWLPPPGMDPGKTNQVPARSRATT